MNITIVPPILIAVAAVLVDATIRADLYRDRIWIQSVLWLAASVQKFTEDDEESLRTWILIHLVFFSSTTSAVYRAWRVQCRWATSGVNDMDCSRFLAPSILVPILFRCIVPSNDDTGSMDVKCAFLFIVSFALLCGRKWYRIHQHQARHYLMGLPTVVSATNLSSKFINESVWFEWTTSEVLFWIASREGAYDWSTACSILSPEQISGSVLDKLTAADLRLMGMPYGLACSLEREIRYLISRNPADRRVQRWNEQPEQDILHTFGWLDKTTNSNYNLETNEPPSHPPYSFGNEHDELDESIVQRAKELMEERFGLELPEMRTHAAAKSQDASEPVSLDLPWSEDAKEEPVQHGPPLAVLESMPPRIRDIAVRNPDLVQKLLSAQQAKESETPSLSIQNLRIRNAEYLQRQVDAQAPAASTMDAEEIAIHCEMEDHSSDGERTALLRKRAGWSKYTPTTR